jgi:hypothetical protein
MSTRQMDGKRAEHISAQSHLHQRALEIQAYAVPAGQFSEHQLKGHGGEKHQESHKLYPLRCGRKSSLFMIS